MCYGGSCDIEDGPAVSGGAGAVRGGTEGDESGTKVLSTSTTGTGCSPLGRSSVNHPLPPPADLKEMRVP